MGVMARRRSAGPKGLAPENALRLLTMIRITTMIRTARMRQSEEPPPAAADAVTEVLSEALPQWKARRRPRTKGDFDLELSGPHGAALQVNIKEARDTRPDTVEGALARAILQLQRLDIEGATLVVALTVPRIGSKTVERVRAFMAAHGPAMGWAVVAPDRSFAIEIPSVAVSKRSIESHATTRTLPVSGSSALFTDLNCWLLKVLLLKDVGPELWGGPRGPLQTPMELMKAGAVSRITAYRFVRTFTEADYLRVTPTGMQIVRREALVRAWRGAAESAVVHAMPVRWMLGRPPRVEDVFDMGTMRYAITGFEACRRLGMLHANSKRTEVYVPHVERAMRRLDLAPTSTGEADFHLLTSTQSVDRGARLVDGAMVVDVLQAAIDVDRNAARGREQSDYIFHDVLGWRSV